MLFELTLIKEFKVSILKLRFVVFILIAYVCHFWVKAKFSINQILSCKDKDSWTSKCISPQEWFETVSFDNILSDMFSAPITSKLILSLKQRGSPLILFSLENECFRFFSLCIFLKPPIYFQKRVFNNLEQKCRIHNSDFEVQNLTD